MFLKMHQTWCGNRPYYTLESIPWDHIVPPAGDTSPQLNSQNTRVFFKERTYLELCYLLLTHKCPKSISTCVPSGQTLIYWPQRNRWTLTVQKQNWCERESCWAPIHTDCQVWISKPDWIPRWTEATGAGQTDEPETSNEVSVVPDRSVLVNLLWKSFSVLDDVFMRLRRPVTFRFQNIAEIHAWPFHFITGLARRNMHQPSDNVGAQAEWTPTQICHRVCSVLLMRFFKWWVNLYEDLIIKPHMIIIQKWLRDENEDQCFLLKAPRILWVFSADLEQTSFRLTPFSWYFSSGCSLPAHHETFVIWADWWEHNCGNIWRLHVVLRFTQLWAFLLRFAGAAQETVSSFHTIIYVDVMRKEEMFSHSHQVVLVYVKCHS